jgi:hypothetical protein
VTVQAVAPLEKFGFCQVIGLGDSAAERIVFVVLGAPVQFCDAGKPVLAVEGITGDQFLVLSLSFHFQIAYKNRTICNSLDPIQHGILIKVSLSKAIPSRL